MPPALDAATLGVAVTGQTLCYDAAGTVIPCAGTGQDGDTLAGVPWPDPRFTDNGDGTVTDNLTGLIWLQDANCFGNRSWAAALLDVQSVADGVCGLTDGSASCDWRLPNAREIFSLVDYSRYEPALPDSHPFTNLPGPSDITSFWSSSTWAAIPSWAWYDLIAETGQFVFAVKTSAFRVWPVRSDPKISSNGFESGDPGEWVVTGVGRVTADPSAAHSGSYGLEVTVDPSCSSSNDSVLVDQMVDDFLFVESCDSVMAGEGFTVAWEAAASATASLTVNDGTPEELTGLDTDERRIDFVRWGSVGGTIGDSSGTVDMDDFTSSR
jgi:hypothetical protein